MLVFLVLVERVCMDCAQAGWCFHGCGIPNDLAVNGARDAVLELQVHLGDGVLGEDGGIRDITCVSAVSRRIRDGIETDWRSKRSDRLFVGVRCRKLTGSTYG